MSKFKVENPRKGGKTNSERESKIFSPSLGNQRSSLGDFCNEAGLEMIEKRFLSGEE